MARKNARPAAKKRLAKKRDAVARAEALSKLPYGHPARARKPSPPVLPRHRDPLFNTPGVFVITNS